MGCGKIGDGTGAVNIDPGLINRGLLIRGVLPK